jgi:predicted DNA-binding transcriptional regulator AlpA
MSAEPVTLSDLQLARLAEMLAPLIAEIQAPLIAEMLAPLIAEELQARGAPPENQARPSGLLDASEAAARLGVGRAWVYRHAAELGAVKLGDGRRARLRFDAESLSELATARVENRDSSAPLAPRRRPSRRSPGGRTARGNPLLPIPAYDQGDQSSGAAT